MDRRCCVCDRDLEPDEGHHLGGRLFCSDHFSRALAASRGGWSRMGLIEIVAVAVFVAIASFLGTRGPEVSPSLALGVALALVPATVLMVYVYRLDRIEPEPWGLVVGVFVLGALFGYGVAMPLSDAVFAVSEWRHTSPLASIVAAICVVGTLQQLCAYVAVRYSVYLTDEFDEPADGLVYTVAAGLGVATAVNVDFVVGNDGALSFAGATHIATVCLVHVAACAALGYGLGRNRFMGHPRQLWLGGAFALSVLLNGGLKQLAVVVGIDGGTFRPWISLGVAAVVVAAIVVTIDVLMGRLSLENFAEPVKEDRP